MRMNIENNLVWGNFVKSFVLSDSSRETRRLGLELKERYNAKIGYNSLISGAEFEFWVDFVDAESYALFLLEWS